MKLLLTSVVLGAFLAQANAFPSLKIVANKLVGGARLVVYENCGWPGVSAYWGPPNSLATCHAWAPSPNTFPSYTLICGWSGPISSMCQYVECEIPDLSPTSFFHVRTSSPTTCDEDVDRVQFAFGNLTPLACCP